MKVLTSPSHKVPLAWAEVETPKLGSHDVRVEVRAVSVNPVDWKMRQRDFLGSMQWLIGPSGTLVTGVDFAGIVTEIGQAVTYCKVGDRVVGGTNFARKQHGSYAKHVQVCDDQVVLLPPQVKFDDASCLVVAGVTAHRALFELGKLREKTDARVLVLGAAGGVGHFAIQMAKQAGAVAVGVCSARNVPLVEKLGNIAVDYTKGEVFAQAAQHGPYDVIVDAVGAASYPISQCVKLLKKGGTHVLVMPKAFDMVRATMPGPVKTLLGMPNRQALEPVVAELAAGRLQVVIEQRIPFDEAERAHEISRGGKVVGKLVLVA